MNRAVVLLLLLALPAVEFGQSQSPPLAFTHVTLIDGTGAEPMSDMTVIITGKRITAIGPSGSLRVPAAARVVNATGKYLIPGLWDMHTHLQSDYPGVNHEMMMPLTLPLFVANGVTGIRDMGGHHPEWIERLRDDIARGRLMGPRIVAAGRPLDGEMPTDAAKQPIANPAEARAAVRASKRSGLDFVKVYDGLARDAYYAAADECKRLGIAFAGHIPFSVTAGEASSAGQKSIEHMGLGRIREACFEFTAAGPAAGADPDSRITRRLKELLTSVWDGSYDSSSFAPLLAAWLETNPAKSWIKAKSRERGKLKSLTFLKNEEDSERQVLHYETEYEKAIVHDSFIITRDGKIDWYQDEPEAFNDAKATALFGLFKRNGTRVTPTLVPLRAIIYRDDPALFRNPHLKYVLPFVRYVLDPAHDVRLQTVSADDLLRLRKGFEKDLYLVKKMRDAGVELLAGTDAITDFCIPGFALHEELTLLVKAGLTPMEALQAATRNPARFLGLLEVLGTIERGKIADLVLLDENPFVDIANTQKIQSVVIGGKLLMKSDLQEMLEKVEASVK